MLLFSQRDPRWRGHPLGWGPALGTIGDYGCFDTVLAMIAHDRGALGANPASLDELFTAQKVFVRDPTGTFDLLPDNALDRVYPAGFQTAGYAGYRADLIALAVASPDTYAVLWISTPSVPTHFVIAWSKDGRYIADPWTGQVGLLAGYGGPAAIHKTLMIRRLPAAAPPAVVVAPPAVAPPATPPVNPTPAQPTPVVQPTLPPATPIPVPTPVLSSVQDASLQGILILLINFWLKLMGRR